MTLEMKCCFLLVVFVACAVAGPLPSRSGQCARHCAESRRFHYVPGTTYTYDYETSATTTIKGTTRDQSQLQIRAQVDIEVLDKCDLSLRLRGVTVKQSDPRSPEYLTPLRGGREFAQMVERHILRFSYQDGRVEELCPSPDAPEWVTNIQRGILSAFQNTMEHLDSNERIIETDVSGKCPVEYQSLGRSWRGTLTVRKLKDLNSCTDRHNADTSIQSVPFAHRSTIQSLPLVSGTQECEQKIGNGIIESSTCTEKHTFRPFSKDGGGAVTTVHQKLSYVTMGKDTFTGNDYRPTKESLLFNHGKLKAASPAAKMDAENTLKELCQASATDISINVPSLFATFIYNLRKLNYNDMVDFYRRVGNICPQNQKAKKFFLDAIPVVATESSVQFMVDMISRQEISDSEANFWFTSLTFVTNPTSEMITILTPLLNSGKEQAYLGISALAHTYCKENDCSSDRAIRDLVDKLMDGLVDNCYNSDEKKVLLTLKAIGNIGQTYNREKVLEQCYSNPQLRTEVRIAAIQAFRRFSCDISRDSFLQTYANNNEDSEIRIASYLASVNCLSDDTLEKIKEVLENEKVNQVGSFVWSHLQALSKSRHPERQDLKNILRNLYLMNKYQTDIRKFSSAHEASVYLDSIESGFHLDSHVIFNTHSYIPHSASLNLTVDIFGHSCNLLQVDGRLEGIEHVLEKFFGPSGYFPQKQVSKFLRQKRAISNDKIDQMDKEFDVKSKFEDKPYGSLDVKIFGNTLWYKQFQEQQEGEADINLMDIISALAEEKEREFSRSFMFTDATYAVPMSTGLPLRLALNGTASVHLKVGGKFNVRSFKHVDVLAHLEPSGAVELAGLLTVDAGTITRTGLRISATLRSSTLLDSTLEINNGEIIKAVINAPRDRIDIIDIQSRLYLVYGEDEREQRAQHRDGYELNTCTGGLSERLLGIQLCADINLPSGQRQTPMYPMNGPTSLSIYLRKTDHGLTKYTFDAAWESKMMNGQHIKQGVISLNTPGSSINRELSMKFNLVEPENTLTLDINTPVKKLGMKAKFANTAPLKKLDVSFSVDDSEKFSLKSEFRSIFEKDSSSYIPNLEIMLHSKKILAVTGSSHLKHGVKYGGELTITEITQKPIILKGSLDIKDKQRYEAELGISSFALDTNVRGFAQAGDTLIGKINADYQVMDGKPYKINISSKIRDLSAHSLRKYTGLLTMQATAIPEWDTSVSWETMQTSGHFENTLSFTIGDDTRSRVHTINLQEIVRYKGNIHDNSVEIMMKMSYPEKNINYGFTMKHENTDRSLKNTMEIQYAVNKQIVTTTEISVRSASSLTANLGLRYPGRDMKIIADISEEKPKGHKCALSVQWQHGQKMSMVAHYRDRGDETHIKREASAEVSFPNRSPMILSCSFDGHNGQYAALADFSYGLEKYRINADYSVGADVNYRFSGGLLIGPDHYTTEAFLQANRDKLTGSWEAKMPTRRRLFAKFDLKNSKRLKVLSIQTAWDADRDQSKQFNIDGEVRTRPTGLDCKFTSQIMRQAIKGVISTTQEGELFSNFYKSVHKAEIEWLPKQRMSVSLDTNLIIENSRHQMSSSLEVTTPYRDYEKLGMSLNHIDEFKQWNSDATFNIGKGRKFSLSTEGKYLWEIRSGSLDATVKIRTPIQGFESILLNATHFHNREEFSNKLHGQWSNGERIDNDLYYSNRNSIIQGRVKLNTPFTHLTELSSEININGPSGSIRAKGDIHLSQHQKFAVVLDSRHAVRERRKMYTGMIIVNTPIRGYEVLSAKTVYNNDGTAINCDTEMLWNRKKMSFGLMGTNKNTFYNKNMEGKFHFTSPFSGFENVQLSGTLQTQPGYYKSNIDIQGPKRISTSFNAEGKFTSINDIELNFVITGDLQQYSSFRKLSLDIVHAFQDNNLRSTFEGAYNEKQIVVLVTGALTQSRYRSRSFEGSAVIKSPFEGIKNLKIDLSQEKQDSDYTTTINVSKDNKIAGLVHMIKIRDMFNFESSLHITSPFEVCKKLQSSVLQVYNPDYFSHSLDVACDEKAFALKAQYEKQPSTSEYVLSLNTPFERVKTLNAISIHRFGYMEYKSESSVKLNNKNVFTVNGNFKNDRLMTVSADVHVITANPDRKDYKALLKYDLTMSKKQYEISCEWDQVKVLKLNGYVDTISSAPELQLALTTPFEGFEQVAVNIQCLYRERKFSLSLEKNSKKITALARYAITSNSLEAELRFTSPIHHARDLRTFAKYHRTDRNTLGEIRVEWKPDAKMVLLGELIKADGRVMTKVSISTPFSEYRSLSLDADIDISRQRNIANFVARWNDKKMELTLECEVTHKREGDFKIVFQSPFQNFRYIVATSHYLIGEDKFDGKLNVNAGQDKLYTGTVVYEKKIFTIHVTSPHSPFRTVELSGSLENRRNYLQAKGGLQWERKRIEGSVLYTSGGETNNAELKITTPFQGYEEFIAKGIVTKKGDTLECALELKTPFQSLRQLEATYTGQWERYSYKGTVTARTPSHRINLSGRIINDPRRPIDILINTETSFSSVGNSEFFMKIDRERTWRDCAAEFKLQLPSSSHNFKGSIKEDGGALKVEVLVQSPNVKNGRIGLTSTFQIDVPIAQMTLNELVHRDFSWETTVYYDGKDHSLTVNTKRESRSTTLEAKINCPYLRERRATVKVVHSQGRSEQQIKLLFSVPSSKHQIVAKYELSKHKITWNVNVESNLLSSAPVDISLNYENESNRDIEVAVGYTWLGETYNIVSNLKNYDGEKFIQLKSKLPSGEISITGSVKSNGRTSGSAALTVTYPSGEIRFAGSAKRTRWQNMEAFFTLNTPYEPVRMIRVDTGYKNYAYKTMELNLRIMTSKRNYEHFGVNAKMNRDNELGDLSITIFIPHDVHRRLGYRGRAPADNLQRYGLHGRYTVSDDNGVTIDGKVEWATTNYSIEGHAQFIGDTKGGSFNIQHPTSGLYRLGGYYTSGYERRSVKMFYADPFHLPTNITLTADYITPNNVDLVAAAELPFRNYRHLEVRAKHQRNRHQLFVNIEGLANGHRAFVNVFRRFNNTDFTTNVRAVFPTSAIKDVHLSLTCSNVGTEKVLEFAYNQKRQIKAEMKTSRGSHHYSLELPTIPLMLSMKIRPEYEIVVRSNYPTRIMSFTLNRRGDRPGLWSHEATLVYDEAARKQVSCSYTLMDSHKGQRTEKEILVRLDLPQRSLECKGKYTESDRATSGGVNFSWDASPEKSKYIEAGFEHQDMSTAAEMVHKLQFGFRHPSLPKDIVQNNMLSLSAKEFIMRSELQYSRYQERNIVAELKATEISRRHADTRYKAEFSIIQLATRLHCFTVAEVSNNREESIAHIKFYNMNRDGRSVSHELRAKLQKMKQQVDLLVKYGENQLSILGRMLNRDDSFALSMDQRWNEREVSHAHIKLNKVLKTFDLNASTTGNRGIHLSASFPEDSASLQLTRSNDLSVTTDAFMFIGLEKSRILKTRIHWRPGMWREFRIATGDAVRKLSVKAGRSFEDMKSEFMEEAHYRMRLINNDAFNQLQPFVKDLSQDLTTISNEISAAKDHFRTMYNEDQFYMKTMSKGMKKVQRAFRNYLEIATEVVNVIVNIIHEEAEDMYYILCDYCEEFRASMHTVWKELKKNAAKIHYKVQTALYDVHKDLCRLVFNTFQNFKAAVKEFCNAAVAYVESSVKKHAPFIIDGYYSLRKISDKIRNYVIETTNSFTETVTNHPLYIALEDFWTRVVTTIRTFQMVDLTSAVQSRVLFMGQKAGVFLNQLTDSEVLDVIRNRIPVDYVTSAAKATMEKSVQLYTTLGIDRLLKNLLNYAFDYVKREALSSGQDLLHELYRLKTGQKYDFNPRNGSLYFEYELPSSRKNIYEVFEFATYPEFKKISEIKQALITKYYEDFCIWDTYYRMVNLFSPRNWLPPYMAHAILAGNQHYVTFDNLAFEFAGECSYLLARDFEDGNFTVVVNYQRDANRVVRKSLTIALEGHSIEMLNDYKVTLDGVRTELPFRSGHTAVTREGPNVRAENQKRGFVVVCNFVHDVCSFGMSGFYFAKTGGLFGTYDYEPHLDMMTPQKILANDVESFANSWEVGQTACRRTENMATLPSNDHRIERNCRALFQESSSNFRACFKQVDPEPYRNMCVRDLSAVEESKFDSAICTSAATYFTQCRIANVQLKMPRSCVTCNTHQSKPMYEGDVMKIPPHHSSATAPRHATVVFVVEEKKCNEENFKYLPKLAHSIEDNFRQKGFLDIYYRVVGFGGNDVHAEPHIHTMDGKEHGSIRAVESAFTTLKVGDGPSNMLEALRFAASLDFMPGTSKTFILVKCTTCKAEESKSEYGEILRTLIDGDVSLHLLMEQKYEMRIANKNSKARKVIGLDKDFAYTLKDIRDSNLLGDEDLLLQLKLPKDVCVPLALEVNGSSFDSQYLTEIKRNTYKKFMDVFTRRMVKSAERKPEYPMCCECISTSEGVGKSLCQRCVSDQVANMLTDQATENYNPNHNEGTKKSAARQPGRRHRSSRTKGH